MKRKTRDVMNTTEVAVQEVENTVVVNNNLKTLIDEICMADEFSILRETLRLYVEEIGVH
jgi:hypothetical protein